MAGLDHSEEMVRLARERAPGAEVDPRRCPAAPLRGCVVHGDRDVDRVVVPAAPRRGFVRVPSRTGAGRRIAVYTSSPALRGTPAAPEPLARRATSMRTRSWPSSPSGGLRRRPWWSTTAAVSCSRRIRDNKAPLLVARRDHLPRRPSSAPGGRWRVGPEAPEIALGIACGEVARAVIGVGQLPDDLRPRRDGAVVERVGVVGRQVDPALTSVRPPTRGRRPRARCRASRCLRSREARRGAGRPPIRCARPAPPRSRTPRRGSRSPRRGRGSAVWDRWPWR